MLITKDVVIEGVTYTLRALREEDFDQIKQEMIASIEERKQKGDI